MIIKEEETIINFMNGQAADHKGRTYKSIVTCSDETMERCHDQVQWMFPLHEESNFASTYPVVTAEIINKAKESEDIIDNLKIAKDRMEQFYAIGSYEDVDKQRKWCKEGNHNLLRITRIIRCLRIFGLESEAQNFYKKVTKASDRFLMDNNPTFIYWEKAIKDDIWETLK